MFTNVCVWYVCMCDVCFCVCDFKNNHNCVIDGVPENREERHFLGLLKCKEGT